MFSRKIKANTDKDVRRFAISRRLNEFGFTARCPATKPMISKKNRKARLEYAEAHAVWRDEDWTESTSATRVRPIYWVRWQTLC